MLKNISKKLTNREFIDKSNNIHNFIYDYSLVDYKNNHTNVLIICETHGEFLQSPNSHFAGRGCRKCGFIKSAKTNTGLPRCDIGMKGGDKFNRLTIIERLPNDEKQNSVFKCRCECGKEKNVAGTLLRNNYIKSCGCLQKDAMFSRRKGKAVYNILFRAIHNDCKKRKLPLDITVNDVEQITNKNCFYCKREPYSKKCVYQKPNSTIEDNCLVLNGIDRVIPKKGYTKDNVVPCCKYCNRAKSDLSCEDFKNLITLIFENYVKTEN